MAGPSSGELFGLYLAVSAEIKANGFAIDSRLSFSRLTLTIAESRDPDDVARTATHSVGANPNLIHVESGLA